MQKSVTLIIAFVLIAVMITGLTVSADGPIVIRVAHSQGESEDLIKTPYTALIGTFKRVVEQKSNGRIKVNVFPDGQLGTLQSMMEQCSRGLIESTAAQSAGDLAKYDPIFQLLEIPYAFSTTESALKVLNGPFGDKLNQKLIEVANLRILAWLPSAFRNFSNNVRPIKTPEDMKGLQIRTMNIPIHIETVKALGAQPTPVAWNELYSALQMGVVDGQENAPYTVLMGSIEEVQKYYTLDHHFLNAILFMMNEDFYQSLSPQDQKIIDFAAREAQFAFLGLVKAKESEDLKLLSKRMEIYVPTQEELQLFKDAAQPPVINILKDKIGGEVIDEFLKTIKEAEEELNY